MTFNNANNQGGAMSGVMSGAMSGGGLTSFQQPQQGGAMSGAMSGAMAGVFQAAPNGIAQVGGFDQQKPMERITEALGLSGMNADYSSPMAGEGTTFGAQVVKIRSVSLGATRPQTIQHRRSYDVFADRNTLQAITNAVLESGSNTTSPMEMATMLANPQTSGKGIIQYSGTPEASVGIVNNWDIQRFRFVIIADIFRAGHLTRTEIISGYTDEYGVNNASLANSRSVNPAMKFIINNITQAGISRSYGLGSNAAIAKIQGSSSVLTNPVWSGPTGQNQMYMARPKDVANTYAKLPLVRGQEAMNAANFSNGNGSFAGSSILDVDSLLAGTTQMSNSQSGLAPTYSARIINGLLSQELPENDPMQMDGSEGPATMAAARMREQAFSNQSFISAIRSVSTNHINGDATFTYADLLKLDSTVDSRCTVFTLARENGGSALYVPDGSSVSNIAESTPTGMASTMITQGLNGLMLSGGVSFITMVATNYGGSTVVVPTGFDGVDSDGLLSNRVQMLCDRMKIEVFDIITNQDMGARIHCEVIADAFNDIFIKLELDGVKGDFVYPAFASSSTTPILTNDKMKLNTLASGISDVVGVIQASFNSKANNDRPSFGGGFAASY